MGTAPSTSRTVKLIESDVFKVSEAIVPIGCHPGRRKVEMSSGRVTQENKPLLLHITEHVLIKTGLIGAIDAVAIVIHVRIAVSSLSTWVHVRDLVVAVSSSPVTSSKHGVLRRTEAISLNINQKQVLLKHSINLALDVMTTGVDRLLSILSRRAENRRLKEFDHTLKVLTTSRDWTNLLVLGVCQCQKRGREREESLRVLFKPSLEHLRDRQLREQVGAIEEAPKHFSVSCLSLNFPDVTDFTSFLLKSSSYSRPSGRGRR
jgi:hypothetical protein